MIHIEFHSVQTAVQFLKVWDTFEVNNLGNYFDGALHSNNQKSIGDQSPFNLQTSTILISSECLETETQSVSDINSCKDPQKEYQTTPFSDMNKTAGNYSPLESNKLLSSDIFCARLPNDKLVDHNNVDSKLQQQHHSCDTVFGFLSDNSIRSG